MSRRPQQQQQHQGSQQHTAWATCCSRQQKAQFSTRDTIQQTQAMMHSGIKRVCAAHHTVPRHLCVCMCEVEPGLTYTAATVNKGQGGALPPTLAQRGLTHYHRSNATQLPTACSYIFSCTPTQTCCTPAKPHSRHHHARSDTQEVGLLTRFERQQTLHCTALHSLNMQKITGHSAYIYMQC